MPHIVVDPESRSLDRRFVLIRTPRKSRKRFPAACVEVVGSQEDALAGANPERKLHPAIVYGPSTSSEGQQIYYLVQWL